MTVPDRYYKTAEYKALSLEQKAGLQKQRDKRGGPPRRKGRSRSNGKQKKKEKAVPKSGAQKQGVHLSNRSIKALVSAMQDDTTEATTPDSDSDSEDEEVEMAAPAAGKKRKGTNRNNPALKRQKRKGGR